MTETTFACDWAAARSEEPSIRVIQRVAKARLRQTRRGQENATLSGRALEEACALKADAADLLDRAVYAQGMVGRDVVATLRVARTLADLEGVDELRRVHVAEALIYRFLRPRYEPEFS